MEKTHEYTIVRANAENISDLAKLFLETNGHVVEVSYLQQKFNTAYTGKSYFAHFAYAPDGSPAAFFCLFQGSYWERRLKKDHIPTEGVAIVFSNLNQPEQKLQLDFTGADTDVF
jgi:hypothetical protein